PQQSTVERSLVDPDPAPLAAPSQSTNAPPTPSSSTEGTSAPASSADPTPQQPTAAERLQQTRAAFAQELQRPYTPSRLPEMGKVIMTACAELQADMLDCIYNGSIAERAKLCQTQSTRFWKCAEDYKYVLKRMGYTNKGVRDEQREVMVREANRIVQHAWTMDNETDVLQKFFAVSL
ncbi:hypothetical protein BCR44DRAFT_110167, partial [Catenaria anguillulae PL171]